MPIPVISMAQMREWEKATWAAGRSEADVIRRVGHIIAARAEQMTRPGDLILVLAGKGHNGDDARQTSQNLADREVYLINVAEPEASLSEFLSQLSLQPALIVDGLFGIGLNRALDNHWVTLIEQINHSGIPILSIDVPSGLNADTGQPHGTAIHASVTLTLAAPKRGLLAASAWPFVGRLEVAPDIGLVSFPLQSRTQWTTREDFANYPPTRPVAGHKGTFGHLAIFGGSLGYHGAAVLAARGALRARPGLVTAFTTEEVYVPVASQLQSAMVQPWQLGKRFADSFTAVLIGPGFASQNLPSDLKSEMAYLWKELPIPVVADASGLDWLASGPIQAKALRVITPHPGEAARLLKTTTAAVQESRPETLDQLSRLFGNCWVALKGHQSLIGGGGIQEVFVNSSGNPYLAQGGSGDVLAGYLAGLLAQPQLQADPLKALRYSVWQHGAAADLLSSRQPNWVLDDLLEALGSLPSDDLRRAVL
ncbi:MAG: NAD(P)H-hydrate dehydratase [Verrucomicrobia bacterium]|nr:NAD(P)H-hydrate dehydratase [Verrucomicrobiota bacterium]